MAENSVKISENPKLLARLEQEGLPYIPGMPIDPATAEFLMEGKVEISLFLCLARKLLFRENSCKNFRIFTDLSPFRGAFSGRFG